MPNVIERYREFKSYASMHGPISGLFAAFSQIFSSPYGCVFELIDREISTGFSVSLPISQRLKAYRYGFTSRLYNMYHLQNNEHRELYLSEYDYLAYVRPINPKPEMLNDKKIFHEFITELGFNKYLPKLFGVIEKGKFSGNKNINDLLSEKEKMVLKPYKAGAHCWESLKQDILNIVNKVPHFKFVGWDILITGNNGGFLIIEANNMPDPIIFQIYRPLLEDEHIREFFIENGVPV